MTDLAPGDRVVVPFNISCGHCFMCDARPAVAVRDDAGARAGHGRGAASATPSSTARCRAGRPSSCACRRRTTGRSRCPRGRPTTASCSSPTCCRPRGRRSSTRTSRRAAASPCSGWARSARCARGSPSTSASRRCIGRRPRARAARARPRRTASKTLDLEGARRLAEAVRELTDGRGPDAVIDAVGMEAHGSPVGKLAQTLAGLLPDAHRAQGDRDGRRRPARRAAPRDRARPPRRHGLAVRRLRRRGRPDAHDADVRQAAHAADGPGQRPALGRRHPAAAVRRRRSARRRRLRHAPRAARRGPAAYEMFQKKQDGAFKVVFQP